jgi:hypothetical protein
MAICSQQADGWLLESRCQGEALKVPASEESGCQDEAFKIPASEDFCLPLELELCSGRRERLDTPEWWPTMSATSSMSTTFSGCSSWPLAEMDVLCSGLRERLDTPEWWPTMSATSSMSTTFSGCSSWPLAESVFDDDVTASVSFAPPRSASDLASDGDQKEEDGQPRAKKESGRARQRRAKARRKLACAQLDLC